MNSFTDFLTARRRGVVLQALAASEPGVVVAADLLHKYCIAVGLRCTRATVDADVEWLGQRGLVQVGKTNGLLMTSITRDGNEVVKRLATVPGVDVSKDGA